jgi:hypothetical protein
MNALTSLHVPAYITPLAGELHQEQVQCCAGWEHHVCNGNNSPAYMDQLL